MTLKPCFRMTAACLGAVMSLSAVEIAQAAPIRIQTLSVISPDSLITDVRVRRRIRHRRAYRSNAVIPGAVLGLFGAALGAAVAGDRYDNYSTYSYGYPDGYGYGYDPTYLGDPGYGYVQPNFGGSGGYTGGGRRGGGPRGGAGGHAAPGGGGHPGGGGAHAGGGGGHPGGGKH